MEKLFDLVVNEIEELSGGERQKLGNLFKDLLNSMPRHLGAVSKEAMPGVIETEITWDTSCSKYFKTSFDVFVYNSDYGSIAKAEHRFHGLSNADTVVSDAPLQQSDGNNSSALSPKTSENGPVESSAESSPEVIREDPISPPVEDHLWREKAERTRAITIKSPTSTLSPGKKYVALIRPTEERQSFFSEPFEFEIQCPAPQNVEVKKVGSTIDVTWDFPYPDINVEFRVVCESVYKDHHRSVLLSERQYAFTVDLDVLAEELEVTVKAKSENGVKSVSSTPVKVPPEALHTTSPSEQSEDDISDGGGFGSPVEDDADRSPSVRSIRAFPSKSPPSSNIRDGVTEQSSRVKKRFTRKRRQSSALRNVGDTPSSTSQNQTTIAQVETEEELDDGLVDTFQQEGEEEMSISPRPESDVSRSSYTR